MKPKPMPMKPIGPSKMAPKQSMGYPHVNLGKYLHPKKGK